MLPKSHILFGAIFSLILYLVFPNLSILNISLIFLSSVLIDFDHYVLGAMRNKTLNLKKIYFWYKSLGKKHKPIMNIFHSIEFIVLTGILAFYFNFFFFILIGIIFHSILDLIEMIYNHRIRCREFSLIRFLILRKKYPNKFF